MQTILGAGGVIGKELARNLRQYDNHIRLCSRTPEKVHPDDELMSCDLTQTDKVMAAVEGSDVAYLTAGLVYNLKTWRAAWPVIMKNVIVACKTHGTKLVFFDNVYAYDQAHIPHMTEETPINPPSKKGQVRAALVQMIQQEIQSGTLTALIARSADFYGPQCPSSLLTQTVFGNFQKGKKANWPCSVTYKHSFTYTPDAAKATAILGNTADAFNQVWHLPTAANPMTGKEWIDTIAAAMGKKPGYMVAGKTMFALMGLFMPIMRELKEMLYQYNRDYIFDSSKFVNRFSFQPTPYPEGIRQIVAADYQ